MANQDIEWLLKEKYGGERTEAFYADCKRLALGEPLAYLIGWTPFLNTKIHLDSHPLIPRPETEYWVELAIKGLQDSAQPSLGLVKTTARVLDLCAGSGCIGVAVATALPSARINFVELDAAHVPTIEKNLRENDINSERTNVYHGNLFAPVSGAYDLILSNPPYVDGNLNRVEDSVRKHEPAMAVYGGEQGFDIIERIIQEASRHLALNGQLWIEHEPEHVALIADCAAKSGLRANTRPDQYDVLRYSVLMLQ